MNDFHQKQRNDSLMKNYNVSKVQHIERSHCRSRREARKSMPCPGPPRRLWRGQFYSYRRERVEQIRRRQDTNANLQFIQARECQHAVAAIQTKNTKHEKLPREQLDLRRETKTAEGNGIWSNPKFLREQRLKMRFSKMNSIRLGGIPENLILQYGGIKKVPHTNNFPHAIMRFVFSFLSTWEVKGLEIVCKNWRSIINTDTLNEFATVSKNPRQKFKRGLSPAPNNENEARHVTQKALQSLIILKRESNVASLRSRKSFGALAFSEQKSTKSSRPSSFEDHDDDRRTLLNVVVDDDDEEE